MSKVDIARALKDQAYFNSLSEEDKALVRNTNPVGDATLSDQQLDTVSGGLEGGDRPMSTTTTTKLESCTCPKVYAVPIDATPTQPTQPTQPSEGCFCAC